MKKITSIAGDQVIASDAEKQAYLDFCNQHGIFVDDSEAGHKNSNTFYEYFIRWGVDIDPTTMQKAFDVLRPHLTLKSEAQRDAEKAANENPSIAPALADWFDHQTRLVNQGDEGFRNFAILIREIGPGRAVTSETIAQAEGRIAFNGRRQLTYVPQSGQVDPRRHQSDGSNPFSTEGLTRQPDGSFGKGPGQIAKEAREAAKVNPFQQNNERILQARAKQECETLRGNTHSQTEQLSKIIRTDASGNTDWVKTLAARKAAQNNRSIH